MRQHALKYAFDFLGLNEQESQLHANEAYNAFITARSQVTVAPQVLALLKNLSQKYTLTAITNGNVDISKFCLKDSFEFLLMAGFDGAQKPSGEMFKLASKKLNVKLENILHYSFAKQYFGEVVSDLGNNSKFSTTLVKKQMFRW